MGAEATRIGSPETLLTGYAAQSLHLGCIGSHSALEIAYGAREEGLRTVVVCESGRDQTYTRRYRHLFDEVLVLDRFVDVATTDVVARLRELNTVFVPNRSFAVYVGYDAIETRFPVPLFGGRRLLRAEERTASPNQYDLLETAGVRSPRRFNSPDQIDRLVMVKLPQAQRAVERGFFTAASVDDYRTKSRDLLARNAIRAEDLETATIEEFVVGANFNLDYFVSPLAGQVEFLGADQRIESNIEGVLHMTALEQAILPVQPTLIPVGHRGVTVRESLLDKVFEAGERLASAAAGAYPPGIIGPFALQGIFDDRGEFVCFDVSLRVPGAPILLTTSPYTRYLYGKEMSVGRRIASELHQAATNGRLQEVIT
mgnify:CR=1 FL=1